MEKTMQKVEKALDKLVNQLTEKPVRSAVILVIALWIYRSFLKEEE